MEIVFFLSLCYIPVDVTRKAIIYLLLDCRGFKA